MSNEEDDNSSIGLVFAGVILLIFFWGEPDLLDVLIKFIISRT